MFKKLFFSFRVQIANVITRFYAPEKWYALTFKVSRYLAYVSVQKGLKYTNTYEIKHASKVNEMLSFITRKGREFPIPIKANGLDVFTKPRPNGLVLCSAHIPLSKVALRHLIEMGFKPSVAIAANPGVVDSVAVWGLTEKIPAIRTGAHVLTKAKSILKQQGTVIALVDKELGGTFSSNIFQLAHRLSADVVYFVSELKPDGVVEVSFYESQIVEEEKERVAKKQMGELYHYISDVLARYGNAKMATQASAYSY